MNHEITPFCRVAAALLLPGLLLLAACAPSPRAAPPGANNEPPPGSFGLVAPDRAAALRGLNTPTSRGVVRRAEKLLGSGPAPMAVIHVEGTLPGRGIHDESMRAKQDWPAILEFALAWRVTGQERFLSAAETWLAAWLAVYRVSRNPIDESELERLVLAWDLAGGDATPATRDAMHRFLRELAEGYLGQPSPAKGSTLTNNWNSHRVKLAALAAFALGDREMMKQAEEKYRRQIADNLRPNGMPLDFEQRDALHYVTYDLEPLLAAALAAKAHGLDWYHLRGPLDVGLPEALTWLAPYAEGRTRHREFAAPPRASTRSAAPPGSRASRTRTGTRPWRKRPTSSPRAWTRPGFPWPRGWAKRNPGWPSACPCPPPPESLPEDLAAPPFTPRPALA